MANDDHTFACFSLDVDRDLLLTVAADTRRWIRLSSLKLRSGATRPPKL